MPQTQEVKDTDIKSASLHAAEKSKEKKAGDKKKEIVWYYAVSTMCDSLTTTMMSTNQVNKAIAATQSQAIKINNELLQYQRMGVNAAFTVGTKKNLMAVSNPNDDPNCPGGLNYLLTYKGQQLISVQITVTDLAGGGQKYQHHVPGYKMGSLVWRWTNLSVTNCKNIYNQLQQKGITGVGFYRQANGNDYAQADQKYEGVTAQRDFLQNQLQTVNSGEQLQGNIAGTLGQTATQEIDLIDNTLNLVGKCGDEGANQ